MERHAVRSPLFAAAALALAAAGANAAVINLSGPYTADYDYTATEDTTVNNADSETVANYMKEKGLSVEWIARSGIHYWNFWQECLPKALKKAGESFK